MASSWWLYNVFICAVLISNLAVSASEEDTKINDAQKHRYVATRHNVMGRKVEVGSDNHIDTTTTSFVTATGISIEDTSAVLLQSEDEEVNDGSSLPTTISKRSSSDRTYGTIRGETTHQQHRRTEDLEDMLNGMANKSPEDWEPEEWILMILFLSFFGWLGCCLCTLCCCGSRSPNICAYICFWELCCRGGSDIDRCCDYAMA